MSFGSADRPLVTDYQGRWRRLPVLELTTVRPMTAVDTGYIGFEGRDLVITTANDRRLLDEVVNCQQRQFTSGTQSAQPTMAAASDCLWASKGETQLCAPLLVLNMGKFAGRGQRQRVNWSRKCDLRSRFLVDIPSDPSWKS